MKVIVPWHGRRSSTLVFAMLSLPSLLLLLSPLLSNNNILKHGNSDALALSFVRRRLTENITESRDITVTESRDITVKSCNFTCHLVPIEISFETETYATEDDDADNVVSCVHFNAAIGVQEIYDIDLPEAFFNQYESEILSGESHICIPGAYTVLTPDDSDFDVKWPDDSVLELISSPTNPDPPANMNLPDGFHHQRKLQTSSRLGNKRLLMVRVLGKGGTETPRETKEQLQAAIFGTGPVQPPRSSVVQQLGLASHGALTYEAAIIPNKAPNGVAEVTISIPFAGNIIGGVLKNAMMASLAAYLGQPVNLVADYVLYAIPSGSILAGQTGWTAFTYLYQPFSIFQNSNAISLSVVCHEMGHGIGFRHSGYGTMIYGDPTGYMGISYQSYGTPSKGYNSHKNWVSGWFRPDLMIEIDPTQAGAVSGRLGAIVDYDPSDVRGAVYDAILLKVGNLFMQYNVPRDYNEQGGFPKQVSIVEARSPNVDSKLIVALPVGSEYRYLNFVGNQTLVVSMCARGGTTKTAKFAVVSIYLESGNQTSACGALTYFRKAIS